MITSSHTCCALTDHCGGANCPAREAAIRRTLAQEMQWGQLQLGHDGGGRRHYLDGKPVHCGTLLEMQVVEHKDDDYGGYTAPSHKPGVLVRYEASLAGGGPIRVELYADVGGHTFTASLGTHRFRWPKRGR